MARRSTPERIDAARLAAIRNRLIGEGMTPERADDWIARWTVQAAQDGRERDADYWDACWRWIDGSRRSTGVT